MVSKNSHKAKKGKNPDSICINADWIESVLLNPKQNQGVISAWQENYEKWPKALKNALSERGISIK